MEFALMQLSADASRSLVRHGEFWTNYHPGNVAWLKSEIIRHRMQLGGGRRPINVNPPGLPVVGIYPPKNTTGRPPRY